MQTKYQRGELSLFWAAVFIGVVTLVAVGTLISMRYDRNFLVEAWRRVVHTDPGQSLRQVTESATGSGSIAIRKCIISGKVVYSNVECDSGNPNTSELKLHATRGIEPPKPAASPQADMPPSLQDRMIEKAVQR